MLKIGGQRVPTPLFLLLGVDCILIEAGLIIATCLRFWTHNYGPPTLYLASWQTFFRFFLIILVCELSLYFHDLYDFRLITSVNEVLIRLLQAFGVACVALAVCYFAVPDIGLGRGSAAFAAPLTVGLTLGWRILWLRHCQELGSPERMLILGTGPAGIRLTRDILSRPELRVRVLGFLDEKGENIGKPLVNPGIIGGAIDLESIVREQGITRVVISLAERRGLMPVRQLLHLKFAGVRVEEAHTVLERMTGRIVMEHLSPSWLILSDGFRKSPLLTWAKRFLDIVVSLAALVVSLPLFAAVAVAIWLESGSPVMFRQERTGLLGRSFNMLKFRSMRQDAEKEGPRWAAAADSRITRVGQLIRKLRIDELPQVINVLRGEMSLVGPRPERPHFVAMLEEQIPFYGLRHSVRPGITGWAQVRYQYGGSVEETKTKLEYDFFYIKHLSIMLDLAVLFETLKVMLSGRGAK
jgi:sugar transferase (PEP-CTERM system associated)